MCLYMLVLITSQVLSITWLFSVLCTLLFPFLLPLSPFSSSSSPPCHLLLLVIFFLPFPLPASSFCLHWFSHVLLPHQHILRTFCGGMSSSSRSWALSGQDFQLSSFPEFASRNPLFTQCCASALEGPFILRCASPRTAEQQSEDR